MTLVVDSSVMISLALGEAWAPRDRDLVAPHLIDSEIVSSLRRLERAGLVPAVDVDAGVQIANVWHVQRVGDADLRERALEVARTLGWSRTYDAEYVALAARLGATLVTDDIRLRRGAARLVRTAAPDEV